MPLVYICLLRHLNLLLDSREISSLGDVQLPKHPKRPRSLIETTVRDHQKLSNSASTISTTRLIMAMIARCVLCCVSAFPRIEPKECNMEAF